MEDFMWGVIGIMFIIGLSFMFSEIEERKNKKK